MRVMHSHIHTHNYIYIYDANSNISLYARVCISESRVTSMWMVVSTHVRKSTENVIEDKRQHQWKIPHWNFYWDLGYQVPLVPKSSCKHKYRKTKSELNKLLLFSGVFFSLLLCLWLVGRYIQFSERVWDQLIAANFLIPFQFLCITE